MQSCDGRYIEIKYTNYSQTAIELLPKYMGAIAKLQEMNGIEQHKAQVNFATTLIELSASLIAYEARAFTAL